MSRRIGISWHGGAAAGAPCPAAAAGIGAGRRPWLPWALAAAVFCYYPLCLAANHTEGEDSGHYIEVVRNSNVSEIFYPNHILFASFHWTVFQVWQWAGYRGGPALCMQLGDVLSGAVAILLLVKLARRLGLDDLHSTLCAGLTATSYGFWWYSVEAETYLLPIPFVLLCVWGLLNLAAHDFRVRQFFALGCWFSLATLFHQQHVLLLPLLLITACAIWYRRRDAVPLRSLVTGLIVLLSVAAVLIGTIYLSVAIFIQHCTSLEQIVYWSKGTARNGLWSPWSWANPIKSLVGIGRAICGLHFLYGFDWFCRLIARTMPQQFLPDHVFLAESMAPWVRWLCLGGFAGVVLSGLTVAAACALPARRSRAGAAADLSSNVGAGGSSALLDKPEVAPHRCTTKWEHHNLPRFAFSLFAAMTFAAYFVFNTLWEPQNIEFWIMPIPLAALAAALRLQQRASWRWAASAAVILVAAMFVTNLLGSILPQTTHRGDYWYAANEYLLQQTGPNDLIVTDGGWISDNCLRANTAAQVAVVREMTPEKLAETIARHRRGRVFISSWAITPDPRVVAAATDWDRDQQSVSRLFASFAGDLRKLDDNGYQTVWELPLSPPVRERSGGRG